MGIGCATFIQLLDLSRRFKPEHRSLMLGRQRFQLRHRRLGLPFKQGRHYRTALKKHQLSMPLSELIQPDRYAETMFAKLGFGQVETLDFSDFEHAQILHDLNTPVPEELHGQFGFIFDGGTIEHVIDTKTALENVFAMLAPGGWFVGVNPLNGWPGHGMYQFSPELIYTFWQRSMGCKVHKCVGIGDFPWPFAKNLPDPETIRKRSELSGLRKCQRVNMYYEIEKLVGSNQQQPALQSDYVARWHRSSEGRTHA